MSCFPPLLTSLIGYSVETAELFRRAVCEGCRDCVSRMSDLNRQTLSELAEGERRICKGRDQALTGMLGVAYLLGNTVAKGFSAALLLPDRLPVLPILEQEAIGISELAVYLERVVGEERMGAFPFYSMHLCANQGRGAHALLLTNYCMGEHGRWLLPLAQALDAWRDSLERACVEMIAAFDG